MGDTVRLFDVQQKCTDLAADVHKYLGQGWLRIEQAAMVHALLAASLGYPT